MEGTLAALEAKIATAMTELCGEGDPRVFVKLSSRSPKDAKNRKQVKLDILRSLLQGMFVWLLLVFFHSLLVQGKILFYGGCNIFLGLGIFLA